MTEGDVRPTEVTPSASLSSLALLFLRLGVTAFGGPTVHIALMESEVVRRRRWLSSERFLDLLGASNLIPGPSSTELAIFIGYEQAGWRGLVVSGGCFVLPAAILVAILAWGYVKFGTVPAVAGALYGIKPVVIAIVACALWSLFPKATKRSFVLCGVGFVAASAFALGADAVFVLLGGGVGSTLAYEFGAKKDAARSLPPSLFGMLVANGVSASARVGLAPLFLTFLKIGATVFGSGYVLVAFLRADLVDRLHWLTESQLLDAVAVGQVTPGPVFTTATFIGYVIAGFWGAVVATVGMFLPSFVLVAMARPLLARVRSSPRAGAFLDGVNVASLALMGVVAIQLAKTALVDIPTLVLAIGGALLLVRWKVNPTWLVGGAALVGAITGGTR